MRRSALVLVPFLLFATVACSADSGGSGHSANGAKNLSGERVAMPEQQRGSAAAATKGSGGSAVTRDGLALSRDMIRTGGIVVRVADVDAARRNVVRLAEDTGGYLEAEEGRLEDGTTLTLRVPPKEFTDTADAVAKLGTVVERTVDTEDVTGDVADVKGRLTAARASVARIQRLLKDATTIDEITRIEKELNTREAELESLESRQRALADQTALAKLTVTLHRTASPTPAVAAAAKDTPDSFDDGLSFGWSAFVSIGRVLLVVTGALLPFAIAAALVVVPLIYLSRRRRPRHVA
jgi:hypothetical protein